jgi:hypothetical protein
MDTLNFEFPEHRKFNRLRLSTSSFHVLTPILLAILLIIPISSATIGQETDQELPSNPSTPNASKSSLRPLEIGESSQKSPPVNQNQKSELPLTDAKQAEIEAIQQIRQQLRSSETTALSNLFDDPQEADQQFAEELAKLIMNQEPEPDRQKSHAPLGQPKHRNENQLRPIERRARERFEDWNTGKQEIPPQRHPATAGHSPDDGSYSQQLGDREPPMLQNYPPSQHWQNQNRTPLRVANPFSLQPIPSNPGLRVKVSAVRAVASKLEQAAAELESVQLYDDADTVRAAANGIWRRARSIEADEPRVSDSNVPNLESALKLGR